MVVVVWVGCLFGFGRFVLVVDIGLVLVWV